MKGVIHLNQPEMISFLDDVITIILLVLFNSEIFITIAAKGMYAYKFDEFKAYDLVLITIYDISYFITIF